MNETKSVKALKKQLAAAIAMVTVAAVALGSSTYAWFVNNTTVKATTSSISAQSNSPYMVIKYDASAKDSDLTADVATLKNTPLYPAQWDITDTANAKFETAYASASDKPAMKAGTKKTIGTAGTPAEAVAGEYAVVNTFNISSKGTGLTDLKVSEATIEDNNKGNTQLDDALRVLIVTESGWVLCDKSSVLNSSNQTPGLLGDTITPGKDTEVKMYVYYDGNADNIYTNNIGNLKDASAKITVSFSAIEDLGSQDTNSGKTTTENPDSPQVSEGDQNKEQQEQREQQ